VKVEHFFGLIGATAILLTLSRTMLFVAGVGFLAFAAFLEHMGRKTHEN
jgi:hypothetical protein